EISVTYQLALPDNVVFHPLSELPPLALVSADHPLAKRGKVDLRELSDESFLLLDLPHSRNYFLDLFRRAEVEPRITFRSRSPELIRGLVAHGLGYTIHNAAAANNVTYDGSCVELLQLEETLPSMGIVRLHLRNLALRPAVQAFDSFIRD